MSKVIVVFTEDIKDPEGMAAYGKAAMPTLANGVKVLAVDASPRTLEGEWHGTQTVILEFESEEAVRAWYDSPEYQAAAKLRHAAADSNAAIITAF
ncbi:DUF1330 domain-containing protein [Actinocorallia sp. A-T 12471]|uniref:DUF1330 domain-containing protein n=1 Tax=Actinocorallia sp. A-T 12471 TaxID=3089813 RepID=UPI0029CF3513|nr:DUF1330 domain-containing protein [Actinocorallia sp. A-T 12471]MDX6740758.1 DUF1330 domain-containing protein [Actinocorallia sp. A-T 12471]